MCSVSGLPNWFDNSSPGARLRTMVVYNIKRDQFSKLTGTEQALMRADMALFTRVNPRDRKAAPATKYTYCHYAAHLATSGDKAEQLSNLILNASLIRNTLSLVVRKDLQHKPESFPWLRVESQKVTNMHDLDAYYHSRGGAVFGDYVNPMRTRAQQVMGLLSISCTTAVFYKVYTIKFV